MNMATIEIRTMRRIIWAYVGMGLVGGITFVFSRSEAVLIDGIFNFISAVSMLAGIKIAGLVSRKPTITQPFGFAMYETLYTLFKGVMIFGVIMLAAISNIIKIVIYISAGQFDSINGTAILYYSVVMVCLCSTVYLYLVVQSKKTGNKSIMLATEKTAVLQNAVISGAIGGVFLLSGFLEGTVFDFIMPVTDSIVVLILCVLLIGDPVKIIKNAFGELTIRDTHQEIRVKLSQTTTLLLPKGYELGRISISRLGRTYYFVFMITALKQNLPIDEMDTIQAKIKEVVKVDAPYSFTDIIFSGEKERVSEAFSMEDRSR